MKKGHKLALTAKSVKFTHVQASLEQPALVRPEWVGFDEGNKSATIVTEPTYESVPFPIEIRHLIEFYSK